MRGNARKQHRAYPTALVSNLNMFRRVQARAYELPTNDIQNRGHTRLSQTTLNLVGQPVWIKQALKDGEQPTPLPRLPSSTGTPLLLHTRPR